ncbi:zinc finger BED domain-containing protein 4-like [Epinephelus fuscoguttatus]|uniref:zinc finger BED domain-containing protein 4-like n=1 Tax=Epinephelus fuscoguttatus TaxID=293821 RepID=UPI0020D17A90|nr:zinc finger BED domain-containing protein 4-like [Epinephelus fuscoguttatus]
MAEEVSEVLKPLKTLTILISTEATPSAPMIRPLKATVLHSMEPNEGDSATVTQVKAAFRENLEDRYSSCQDFLHKCTALDPKFKALLMPVMTGSTTASPQRLWPWKKRVRRPQGQQQPVHPQRQDTQRHLNHLLLSRSQRWLNCLVSSSRCRWGNKATLQLVKEEVAAYKAASCISVDSDPLLWWKTNEPIYPLTAKLAKRYFTIPVNSVPSERVFSTAEDIVTASRSALTADNVDKLIFLAKNMKVELN